MKKLAWPLLALALALGLSHQVVERLPPLATDWTAPRTWTEPPAPLPFRVAPPQLRLAGWTTPRTWVTSELVSASLLNTHVRDNLDYLKTEQDTIKTDRAQILDVETTHVTGGTSDGDLQTYSMPGGTLATNGQVVRITVYGVNGSNAYNWQLKYYFGAAAFTLHTYGGSTDGKPWAWTIYVIRTGAATQNVWFQGRTGTNADGLTQGSGTAAETLSGAVVSKLTGYNATSGEVTQWGMVHELLNP